MKNIKKYEDFVNEEINLKKALTTGALAAGMALSNPIYSQTKDSDDVKTEVTKKVTQSINTIDNVLNINEEEVSNIKNYETMASIKVPEGFDQKNAKIYASFLWNSNLPSAPFGGMIFIHSPKISFFIDVKSNWKSNNAPAEWPGSFNWVEKSSWTEEGYNWVTTWGSYTKWSKLKSKSVGSTEHKKVFDIGLSKSIHNNNIMDLRAYIGCGLSITKSQMYEMISTYYSEYTWYEYGDQSGGFSTGSRNDNYHEEYKEVETKYEKKLNITGGLLFDFKSGFQMGIGFDTKPAGVNLMIGFNIGKH